MILLTKTIQLWVGLCGGVFDVFLEKENAYSYYKKESVDFSAVWKKIFQYSSLAVVVVCLCMAVFFAHQIVSNEYKIAIADTAIKEEANAYATALAEYAETDAMNTSREKEFLNRKFISVDSPRYVGTDSILQANAVLK
ncbi:MAG: hypothetical protein AAB796_02105 [Patescibacteria group bacterium]